MRHYDRHQFRHLDDADRFRDYDYLADDVWEERSERRAAFPPRARAADVPSWSGEPRWSDRSRPRLDSEFRTIDRSPASRASRAWSRRQGPLDAVRSLVDRLNRSRRELVARLRAVASVVRTGEIAEAATFRLDRRIYEDVRERFERSRDIDARSIDVTVRAGIVTLEGSVPDRRSRYVAENLLEDVLGVRDVANRLRVQRDRWEREGGL